jgi:hypothetical protein
VRINNNNNTNNNNNNTVLPRDMVCIGNICINTLHEGDNDDDDDYNDDDNNNSNNIDTRNYRIRRCRI